CSSSEKPPRRGPPPTFARRRAGIYRILTGLSQPTGAVQGHNPFRHGEIPAARPIAASDRCRNERFSTIFSTGVENFGRKPQRRVHFSSRCAGDRPPNLPHQADKQPERPAFALERN